MPEGLGWIGGQGRESARAEDSLAIGADAGVGVAVLFHAGGGANGAAVCDLGAGGAVGADLVEPDFETVVGVLANGEEAASWRSCGRIAGLSAGFGAEDGAGPRPGQPEY